MFLAACPQAPQQNFLGLAVDLCYEPMDDVHLATPVLQVSVSAEVVGWCLACCLCQICISRRGSALHLDCHSGMLCRPQDLAQVLQEAAEAAGGKLRQAPAGTDGFQLPATFGPQHRGVQLVQLLNALLEKAG
jgi:hypothetical protein